MTLSRFASSAPTSGAMGSWRGIEVERPMRKKQSNLAGHFPSLWRPSTVRAAAANVGHRLMKMLAGTGLVPIWIMRSAIQFFHRFLRAWGASRMGFFSASCLIGDSSISSKRTAGAMTDDAGEAPPALLWTVGTLPAAMIFRRLRTSTELNSQPRTGSSRPSAT